MGYTTDSNDPRLDHGVDEQETPQHEVYLVLSEEERARGFIRPLRRAYIHVGPPGPQYPLRDLTDEESERWHSDIYPPYIKYEEYPKDGTHGNSLGRLWTQERLDKVGGGCGTLTTMGLALCETYAVNPFFYGATYCVGCSKHIKVEEFIWDEDGERLGT